MVEKKIDSYIKRVEQIPTLPIVSQKVLSLLCDDSVSIKKIAALIEKDQALAVKVLKMANSAFYSTLSKVSSIDHALIILGISEVRAILLAFSIYNFFPANRSNGFDRTRFWAHSIICSQVAKYLAHYFNVKANDSLFLSGLIHDMGKVVFDQYFHDEFLEIVDYVSTKHESFSKAEKEILGITHYQVSAKLLQQWRFPDQVVMQVFYHHAPWQDKNYGLGSVIVYLANLLTKLAGFPCHPQEKQLDVAQFAGSKAMDFVVKSGFDLDVDALEKLTYQIKDMVQAEKENIVRFFEA